MSLVDESTLQEAALQLLASSTSQRYSREAARIAQESGLVAAAKVEDTRRKYTARLTELLPTVTQTEGSPAEIEVALLLCALARSVDEATGKQLRELVQPDQMRSPWLAALAMRIPQFGPPMSTELDDLRSQLERMFEGSVEPPSSLDMHDNEDPRLFPRAA